MSTGSKHILIIGITFVVGVAIGVVAIIAIHSLSPPEESGTREVALNDVQHSSTTWSDGASTVNTNEVATLQEIFNLPSVFDRHKELYATLSSSTEQELNVWWNQSQEIERTSHRAIAQEAILRKLATINPRKALQRVEDGLSFRSDAQLTSVFSVWSVSQLDAAIEAASTLSGPRRNVALQAILETRDDLSESRRRAIAKHLELEQTFLKLVSDTRASQSMAEPKVSWDILLNDAVDNSLQAESLSIVAEAWREHVGFKVLSNIYADIESYQMKNQLMRAIAQVDLAGALDYSSRVDDEYEKDHISRVIVREWARSDAQAALIAVSTFEPSSMAANLEDLISGVWATTKPNEAIENIQVLSEELRLFTLEQAFSELARQNPLDALAKVSSVKNFVGNTSSIVESIVDEWARQKPAAAADWVIRNYALDDPQRHPLLSEILPSLARQDPNKAFELAIEHPNPEAGSGLDYVVMLEIARNGNIELAKKLLPRVHENSKARIYSAVGAAMVKESQTDEAMELGKALEESDHQSYYYRVMLEWSSANPKNLYESLEDLSTSEFKSLAATQLVRRNKYYPVLTDDQIDHAKTFIRSDD